MELKRIYQARFSTGYLLLIAEGTSGHWNVEVRGPLPTSRSLDATNLADAEQEAYSIADRFFIEKGIVELRTARENMKWVVQP
jgi:hypothetical protein